LGEDAGEEIEFRYDWEALEMKVVIRLNKREEAKALPILLRHSPGTILPERTYVISEDAVASLRKAGVKFTEREVRAL
jgi:hypothetical protein